MANKEKLANKDLPALLTQENVKKRFTEVLDKNAPNFIQTLLTIYNSNEQFKKCEPVSILAAAGLAATLNLSISPTLGYAYIIPFGNKAQFQIGVKGLVQLAHRTGRYTALHSGVVREGEIRGVDCITGELIRGEKLSEEIIGYVAFMRLDNGFEKSLYMTKEEIEKHADTFSQTYRADKAKNWSSSIWSKHFDRMACKTVLKLLLNRWGVMSAGLQEAIQGDQSVVTKSTFTYVDNDGHTSAREDYSQLEFQTPCGEPATENIEQTPCGEIVNPVTGEVVGF